MPPGPAGTDKAAAEQKLLRRGHGMLSRTGHPGLRSVLMDRKYHGAARIARMIASTHLLIQAQVRPSR